ncbi:MAG: hypothetical protein JWR85_1488 [Marmoricola sp.]|nr:hypothetical protein [Marmoricola sp.]
MSTALSWTELRTSRQDLGSLLAFRRSALSGAGNRRLRVAGVLVLLATVLVVVLPAYLGGDFPRERSGRMLAILPSLCLGFLVLAVFTAVASAGGREIVPRDQAVAFPVSPTTDHLGALLMAPLNIAWIAEAWALLGITAYALGPDRFWLYEIPLLLWILTATAIAQVVGWFAEGVRRGKYGIATFRVVVLVLALGAGALVVTDNLTQLLDRSPTTRILIAVLDVQSGRWVGFGTGVAVLSLLGIAAIVVGALPARWALQRPMREELRLESGRHQARAMPGSDLMMVLRIDRAAVWRSVPLRRGLMVLALMPGAVALAGNLEWRMLTILPGLVASGAALLFGVNTWCLDGRGALWRDSLPVSPRISFASRTVVLLEVLLCSAAATLVLAALRAGRPTAAELTALACSTLVVSTQVVSASMRWSIARPFAVDLRSARATPAPPVVMAGYSARLAMVTTITGLIFSGLAEFDDVRYAVGIAVLMLLWSGWRLERSAQRWDDPATRSRVISVVSGG